VTPGRLAGIVVAACGLEAAAVALAGAPGGKLRFLVDLWTWEALLLGLAGTFLIADRPFLAARAVARRLRGADADSVRDPGARPRSDRAVGVASLALGVALFAAASLAWSLGTR
jgi:hypothetical protein